MKIFAAAVAALVLFSAGVEARKSSDPKECEVCIKVLEGIKETLTNDDVKSQEKVEAKITKFCARKDLDRKSKKACYYFEPIKRSVSKPFTLGLPPTDICMRKLRRKNTELCEMRFPTKIEKGTTDYSKMRIRQLKSILTERGVACTGCLEKDDYVKKCKETEHMEL